MIARRTILLATCLSALALGGCEQVRQWWADLTRPKPPAPAAPKTPRAEPVLVQQARAYPETVTKVFMSLADFETLPGGDPGHEQVKFFQLLPGHYKNTLKFVVNVTRTGAGALEATLAPGVEMIFKIPFTSDFSEYTLLTFALHSETLRDDLRVTLTTDGASWTSHRTLVRPGWNYTLVDIQRLADVPNFDLKGVRAMRLAFVNATKPVRIHLDDIMLVDNRRELTPVPTGMRLEKVGRNFLLSGANLRPPLPLRQSRDGLWRMGPYQPVVQVLPPGRAPAPGRGMENIELLGAHRVGDVQVDEANALRLRLINTWYFPTQAGEWMSLAIRQIRWEHTFYRDGRWVIHIELNNAGGQRISTVKVGLPTTGALFGAGFETELVARDLPGPVGRWDLLMAPSSARGQAVQRSFLAPARVEIALGDGDVYAPGDADRDRFDQTQGCYFLAADASGHCRFSLAPPAAAPLVDPVFRIAGRWVGKVYVQSGGQRVRDIVRLADNSILFVLPGTFTARTAVEVAGKTPLLAD